MKKQIAVRLDEDLYELIKNYACTKNISFSEALREIIRSFFKDYTGDLNRFIVAKIIANDELFYNAVKAKILVDPSAKTLIKAILRELE